MKTIEYLDFDIEIGIGQGREYPVSIIRSPGGEARETILFPFDELSLKSYLQELTIALLRTGGTFRKILSPQEIIVQEFGQKLFDFLFKNDVRSRYDISQREATQSGKGLRIKLRIRDPHLASLPWEFLYDSRAAEYICLSIQTPLVRYIELPKVIEPLSVTSPLRILGVTATPRGFGKLDAENEKKRVQVALSSLLADGDVEVTWLEHATRYDLQRVMRQGPWHILHFIGHGGFDSASDEGIVALENEEGELDQLHATQLARLLGDQSSLRLVILNSCEGAHSGYIDIFSSTASALVRRGIPAVLAMQYEITDRAAIEFSRGFYEAIAEDWPVDAAVTEARKSISLNIANTFEWGTPVLFMRSPDGIIFKRSPNGNLPSSIHDSKKVKKSQELYSPQTKIKSVGPSSKKRVSKKERNAEKSEGTGHVSEIAIDKSNSEKVTNTEIYMGRPGENPGDAGSISVITEEQGELTTRPFTRNSDVQLIPNDEQIVSPQRTQEFFTSIDGVKNDLNDFQLVKASPKPTKNLFWGVIFIGFLSAVFLIIGTRIEQLSLFVNPSSPTPYSTTAVSIESTRSVSTLSPTPISSVKHLSPTPTASPKSVSPTQNVSITHFSLEDIKRIRPVYSWDDLTVYDIAWSPDGQELALASGKNIYVYNASTYQKVKNLEVSTGANAVSFSPDGNLVAAGLNDGTILIWDFLDGKLLHQMSHLPNVRCLTFSPDGTTLASGADDSKVRIWNVSDGKLLQTFDSHKDTIRSISFSPDGAILATGSDDKTAKLWMIATGQVIYTLAKHTDKVNSAVFSLDGATLVTGSSDGKIFFWDIHSGEHRTISIEPKGSIYNLAFSPDGTTLASTSQDGLLNFWDYSSESLLHSVECDRKLMFSPDGSMLACLFWNGTVQILRPTDWTLLYTMHSQVDDSRNRFDNYIENLYFLPNENVLVSVTWNGTIEAWSTYDGNLIKLNDEKKASTNKGHVVAFSPGRTTLAIPSQDGVQIFNSLNGSLVNKFKFPDYIYSMAFSPNGKTLAIGTSENGVEIWEVSSGLKIQSFDIQDSVDQVMFSPDGSLLATVAGYKITIWRTTDGTLMRSYGADSGDTFVNCKFSPDGKFFVTIPYSGATKLWRVSDWSLVSAIEETGVISVDFSPDSLSLAVGFYNGKIMIWSLSDWKLIHSFVGDTGSDLNFLSFSHDGVNLASGSGGGAIRLWGAWP